MEINPLQEKVIFYNFIQFADYPEIVRYCIAHPPSCNTDWAKKVLDEKRTGFINFIYGLPIEQLRQYCNERQDICKLLTVQRALNAIPVFKWESSKEFERLAMNLGDLRDMNNGDEIEIVTIHRSFGDSMDKKVLQDLYGRLVISPLELVKHLNEIHMMRVVDKNSGTIQIRWAYDDDGNWGEQSIDVLVGKNQLIWYPVDRLQNLQKFRGGSAILKTFDNSTLIGWRGPFLRVSDLHKLPWVRLME